MASWDVRHGNATGLPLQEEPESKVGPYYVGFCDNVAQHGPYKTWNEAVTKRNQLRRPPGVGFQQGRSGNDIA